MCVKVSSMKKLDTKKTDKKKIIIVVCLIVVLTIGLLVGSYFITESKNKKKDNIDDVVASSVTLDINPSIKMELNKDRLVVNLISLNEEAKNIVITNYKGSKVDVVIDSITDKLIDKGYAKEELLILVGTTGELKSEEVKEIISNKLNKKNISYDIIIPTVTETSSELARKYNITESKAAYLEEITNKYDDLKMEELKDKSIKEIEVIAKEMDNKKEMETKVEDNNPSTSGTSGGSTNSNNGSEGSLSKCDNVRRVLTNEEAGKKVAGFLGATVGTGSYCDKLAPESIIVLAPDGSCAYKVTFKYRTKRCVYYISVETGNVIGNPECSSEIVEEGEAQCIIMEAMGLTKREMFYPSPATDNGSEYIYKVEDVYGTPDEDGQRYIYEYRVSKHTGQITKKEKIDVLY